VDIYFVPHDTISTFLPRRVAMTNRVFHRIGRFFHGAGDVIGTPSGDARGLVRVYHQPMKVTRGRNF
jgi:hypothetical protein